MTDVLLINPPRDNLVRLELEDFVDLGEISSFPPLGLMYLAQALRLSDPPIGVSIIDCVAEGYTHEEVAEIVCRKNPKIVGLTSFTYTFYDVLETARAVKKKRPETPVVVGGPHMYIFAGETMAHRCFDYGVVGDGEDVLTKLCGAVLAGRPVPEMPGLLVRQGERVLGDGVAAIKNLDRVKTPAVDLVNPFKYYNTIGKTGCVGTICSTRGCPFRCTFCQVPRTSYRSRAIDNIIEEMEIYIKRGITDFFFFDDLFNITKKRVEAFSHEILTRGLKVTWMFRGRVDQIDDAVMSLARRAGCHTVSVGIEDSTDRGLGLINKQITMDQAYQAVRAIRKNNIRCSANWIIGFPHHQTQSDLDHLLETAIRIKSDYAQFSILQCLPGSELYDQAVSEGGIDKDAWKNYVLNPVKGFAPPIWEKHFTRQELFDFYSKAYHRYYMRPGFLIREAFSVRNLPEFHHKVRSFAKVFLNKGKFP